MRNNLLPALALLLSIGAVVAVLSGCSSTDGGSLVNTVECDLHLGGTCPTPTVTPAAVPTP